MKPIAFHFERPASLANASRLLGEDGVFAKAIAGSQSLGPMLNLRLAQPDLLVDVTGIPELTAVESDGTVVEIGACVTHADIEDGRIDDPSNGLMPKVASGIAYRAVRNRGTIGGSLAHADPAADWISILPLLDAELVVCGAQGTRRMAAGELMISSFTTKLASDELIQAVRVPKLPKSARWGFFKFNQKAGEFAHAIGAVVLDRERDIFRAVIGAIETAPIVVEDAAALLDVTSKAGSVPQIDEAAVGKLLDERSVTDTYLRKLAVVALKRAMLEACTP
jgi:carbon-monoxide dehydrogenase medium subunit